MKLLKEELDEKEKPQFLKDTQGLIISLSDKLNECIGLLDQIKLNFEELGIHSVDIDPYFTNYLDRFADTEETDSMSCGDLLERIEEFKNNVDESLKESKSKMLGDDIYDAVHRLGYEVFASSTEDDAFEISKFKEENLQKAKDWCDKNNVRYSIKQKVYSTSPLKKKFYMTIFTK